MGLGAARLPGAPSVTAPEYITASRHRFLNVSVAKPSPRALGEARGRPPPLPYRPLKKGPRTKGILYQSRYRIVISVPASGQLRKLLGFVFAVRPLARPPIGRAR